MTLRDIDAWGASVTESYAKGLREAFSPRSRRRTQMYRRWNRIKGPWLDALAWVFGR